MSTNRVYEHVDPKKKPVISNRLFKIMSSNRVWVHENILQKNPHQINDKAFQEKGDEPSLRTRRSYKKRTPVYKTRVR